MNPLVPCECISYEDYTFIFQHGLGDDCLPGEPEPDCDCDHGHHHDHCGCPHHDSESEEEDDEIPRYSSQLQCDALDSNPKDDFIEFLFNEKACACFFNGFCKK